MADTVFSTRLRQLRKQAGMTQQEVADRLRIHRTTYTKYERGSVTPDQQGLVQLAVLFEVSVDYLLGNDEVDANVTAKGGNDMDLTLQEQQLVQMFRQLTYPEQQALVRQAGKVFRDRSKKK